MSGNSPSSEERRIVTAYARVTSARHSVVNRGITHWGLLSGIFELLFALQGFT